MIANISALGILPHLQLVVVAGGANADMVGSSIVLFEFKSEAAA